MKVLLPASLLAAALALATPAAAEPVARKAPAKGAVAAKVVSCDAALEQAERGFVVEGRMRSMPGAKALLMRFDLQVRAPDEKRFKKVDAPGFDVWNRAAPAPKRYVYEKRVQGLTAPAEYRMVVRYRWTGRGDRKLASAHKTTRICEQPDLRPDLVPRSITPTPGPDAGTRRYLVPVANTGRTDAGPFSVTLTVDGAPAPAQQVTGLAAGARTELSIVAPACSPGSPLRVEVDPDGEVDERDESDDVLVATCP